MAPSKSIYQQSVSETYDQVLELINNCVIGPDDSVLVLQGVLSPQALMTLNTSMRQTTQI